MKSFRVFPFSSSSFRGWLRLLAAVTMLAWVAGCETPPIPLADRDPGPQTLSAGDTIMISFPGAPNLNATQQIRRDGLINLTLVGEVKAADRTPADLEKELVEKYKNDLVSKEVKVTVVSSSYAVFVSGAVLRPGKVTPLRTITALEAIMESGGFDPVRANARKVRVLRHEGDHTKTFTLNLQSALDGKSTDPFYLRGNDIVVVPEKFVFF